MPVSQAAALWLFNSAKRLTAEEAGAALNLPPADTARVLSSVSCAKFPILAKSPPGAEVAPGDVFCANERFQPRSRRISVPLPPLAEKKKAIEEVAEDRKYSVDAAVMRIMKAKKTAAHNELIMEVVKQVAGRFVAAPTFVKKRIESLIEREFLERDKENRAAYCYVA